MLKQEFKKKSRDAQLLRNSIKKLNQKLKIQVIKTITLRYQRHEMQLQRDTPNKAHDLMEIVRLHNKQYYDTCPNEDCSRTLKTL